MDRTKEQHKVITTDTQTSKKHEKPKQKRNSYP